MFQVLGGSWVVIRVPLKGSIGFFRGLGFRGGYLWGYKPLKWVITIVTLLKTPLITTHEPPSTRNHATPPQNKQ